MNANVFADITSRRGPRGRAAAALLPGVFAILLAGVSGVAAGPSKPTSPTASPTPTASPSPTLLCNKPNAPRCKRTPPPTLSAPSPSSIGNGGMGGGGGPAPTPLPTSTPAPTSTQVPTSTASGSTGASGGTAPGASGGGHSGGSGGAGSQRATRSQDPTDLAPFAPLTVAGGSLSTKSGLDAARIPPVEALTPLSGLDFGNGLNLGPLLLLIDMIGIGLLVYLVRTRWLTPEA
jgi:hypothetical protein